MRAGSWYVSGAVLSGVFAGVSLFTASPSAAEATTPPNTPAAVTSYTDPSIDYPQGITAGPDGAMWFTNYYGAQQEFEPPPGPGSIGRITTAGVVTNYTGAGIYNPYAITTGPDGALWFTNTASTESLGVGRGFISRITTAGVVTSYTNPEIYDPQGITTGPDGALWFTNPGGNSIGRVTTAGAFTFYAVPSIDSLQGITTGPDGALWFTIPANRTIGRITTAGTLTYYTDPSIDDPQSITAGPDGALWFTNSAANDEPGGGGGPGSIGRITTAGIVTYATSPTISAPEAIAAGPDGALWFTNQVSAPGQGTSSIGRITAQPLSVYTLPAGSIGGLLLIGTLGGGFYVVVRRRGRRAAASARRR